MANYAVNNSTGATYGAALTAVAATYKSICTIGNGSSNAASGFNGASAPTPFIARRGKIYDILVGSVVTAPADTYIQWDLMRMSAVGSSQNAFAGALTSASSLFALDQADIGANSFMVVNSSIETNAVAQNSLMSFGINQRASYRWVAAPGSEFVYPAVSSQGIALRVVAASYTGNVSATVLFQEQ